MTYNILVPDSLHINIRNFPSFFKFVEKEKANITFVSDRKDWIALYGDYSQKEDILKDKFDILASLTLSQLYDFKIKEVNLFFIARAEILSLVIKNTEWISDSIPSDQFKICQKLYDHNPDILLSCLAAAWDWIEYWYTFLQDNKLFTHSCIFSGSLIYQRSLIELLRFRPTKVMLMESFFTGNDYYCEEKYEPIANNCDIKYKAIYRSLLEDLSPNLKERELMKAINKVILSKNKNVIQPTIGDEITFNNDGLIVTILGQVVNDFSLLEYKGYGLSSIDFYTKLVSLLIDNNINVIFKAHPWEAKKINITDSFTKNKMEELRDCLSDEKKNSLVIVDDYPITKLFEISNYIVGLNSQGLLEAAFDGFKPVQFGNAFYGNKGFTNDYQLSDISVFVDDILSGAIHGNMTLAEYDSFQTFLLKIFQGQLVSIHNSGVSKLSSIFCDINTIKLVHKTNQKVETINNVDQKICVEKKVKVVDTITPVEKNREVEEFQMDISIPRDVKEVENVWRRKYQKFRRDPRKFCADSDNLIIRASKNFFRRK